MENKKKISDFINAEYLNAGYFEKMRNSITRNLPPAATGETRDAMVYNELMALCLDGAANRMKRTMTVDEKRFILRQVSAFFAPQG